MVLLRRDYGWGIGLKEIRHASCEHKFMNPRWKKETLRAAILPTSAGMNANAMTQKMKWMRMSEKEKTFTGMVTSIDPNARALNVRDWSMRQRSFLLSERCECTQLGKDHASINDLRAGEKVTVRYRHWGTRRLVFYLEQQPMRLQGIIRSLDAKNGIIILHQAMFDRELRWDSNYEIRLHGGKPGTIADLSIGNHVRTIYEAPDDMLTARRIEQTSNEYEGRLTAIDLEAHTLNAKAHAGTKKFVLAPPCPIIVQGHLDGRLADLRLTDKVLISYDEVNEANVANRIAVVETLLDATPEPTSWF